MSRLDPDPDTRIVVVGVGNPFRSDDGVGHRVAQLVEDELRAAASGSAGARRSRHLAHTEVVLSDGEASRLVDAWTGADLVVVVDAVATGSVPGRVRVWEAGRHPLPVRGATSTHASGVAEAWALGEALGALPGRLLVVGIEGACFDDGTELSPPVADAVAVARRLVRAAIATTRSHPTAHLPSSAFAVPGEVKGETVDVVDVDGSAHLTDAGVEPDAGPAQTPGAGAAPV